ncbi:TPA: hypothetical protein ACJI7W_004837, partial [Escherichia coli]
MLNTDSLVTSAPVAWHVPHENIPASRRVNADFPFHKIIHQSFVKSVDNHLFNNLKIRYFTWVVTKGLHCVNAFYLQKNGEVLQRLRKA